jgi:hypothetical protein
VTSTLPGMPRPRPHLGQGTPSGGPGTAPRGTCRRMDKVTREHRLVLGGELAVPLLGHVEVAEHLSPDQHRDPEEGPHGRVLLREAERGRMGAQVADAQWVRGGDQLAEHALALRQMTHPVGQLLVDAHRDEGTQSATGAEYAQRSVAGVDQARRRLRDLMERRVQVQAGGHAEEGIEQVLHPLLGTGHRREAVLHLGEQLRQPHPGQGGADPQLAVIAGGGGRGPGWLGHRRIRFSVRGPPRHPFRPAPALWPPRTDVRRCVVRARG